MENRAKGLAQMIGKEAKLGLNKSRPKKPITTMPVPRPTPINRTKPKPKPKTKKPMTDRTKQRLKLHRNKHKTSNPKESVNKHMKVMRDLIKMGVSFPKAHTEAQSLYPLK